MKFYDDILHALTGHVALGCYQRTPLYIVLCGHTEQLGLLPRNFFLAKLLIERGSDVNLRIPEVRSSVCYTGSIYNLTFHEIMAYNDVYLTMNH